MRWVYDVLAETTMQKMFADILDVPPEHVHHMFNEGEHASAAITPEIVTDIRVGDASKFQGGSSFEPGAWVMNRIQ